VAGAGSLLRGGRRPHVDGGEARDPDQPDAHEGDRRGRHGRRRRVLPVLHGHDRQREGRDRGGHAAVRRDRARAPLDGSRTVRLRYRGLRGAGQAWEKLAARELSRAGYRILARNYRTKAGEIDLVARDGRTLCFVEVKGRRSLAYGTAAEAVDREK